MKNHEYIRKLPLKELAELLVTTEDINEGDENIDGERMDFYITYYISPNGIRHYDFEDAVESTIYWLASEKNEEE